MGKAAAGLALLFAACTAMAEAPSWDVLMTPEERAATGVDRLHASEREALRQWLLRHTGEAVTDERAEASQQRQRTASDEPDEIRSRIAGTFRGWTGQTRFRLENGQVWQQRRRGQFRYEAERPEVIIRKNLFGFYAMEVPEAGRSVLVQRID